MSQRLGRARHRRSLCSAPVPARRSATSTDALDRDLILDHQHRPRHAGLREPYSAQAHHLNPTCGDQVTVRVHLADDRVADVSYRVLGCTISRASTSMMAEAVIGATVAQALVAHERFTALVRRGAAPGAPRASAVEDVAEDAAVLGDAVALHAVARSPLRLRCALLGWVALHEALLATSAPAAPR